MHRPHRWARGGILVIGAVLALGSLRAAEANNAAVEERLGKDVTYLASDECEGRGVTTKGIHRAADYIANEFKKAGLKPAGPDGSYFQPFTMTGRARLDSPNTLVLRGPQGQQIELKANEHFRTTGLSGTGKVAAGLVFAGYGNTAKEIGYDDFKGIDVAGKVVMFLRKTPRAGNTQAPFDGTRNEYHAGLATKIGNAEQHKAAAILIVNDSDTAQAQDPLMDFNYARGGGASSLPVIHLRRAVADQIVQSVLGVSLRQLEEDIDRDLKPRSAPLAGWTANLETAVKRPVIPCKNVIGVLEGNGPLANEIVVLGAHYDHLGYGDMGGSLARNQKQPAIHHGADDNASGTTMLLEMARRYAAQSGRQGRKLVFMAFSAEEMGLIGSAHYCTKEPLLPLKDTVAMVNMDMVGRLSPDKESGKDRLQVWGTGSAKGFEKLIDELNQKPDYDFKLQKIATGTGPSDHDSFYRKGVPVFFFFTGDHKDYHRPSDTAEKINITGMRRIAGLVEDVTNHLAQVPQRPEYVKVAGGMGRPRTERGGNIPRLGIRPGYGDDKEGVLLEGVTEGGPAAKAGLKEGDRIVAIGDKQVRSLETYMALLAAQKRGEPIELGVLRDGKKIVVQVKPE